MLRPYQIKALDDIRRHYSEGAKRVLLSSSVGSGKTTVFCELMVRAAKKGNRSVFLVRGRKLVSQAAARLESHGVKFSVLMAGDKRENPDALITLCSIDTLYARKLTPKCDIIVIDEAHLAISESFKWFLAQNPHAYILAVTATPFHKEGFRSMADVMVDTIPVSSLIEQGFLVPARYFSPSFPDLSTVKKSQGDFVVKDLAEAMNQSRLFSDVVSSYEKRGEGRPALLFAVDRAHSKRLSEAFNARNIPSLHLDAFHNDEERSIAFDALRTGKIKVLCNVLVAGTGVDEPSVSCVILCRPTLSFSLHHQLIGRGSRPAPGKKDFLVLDCAGNLFRHGFYETPFHATLDGKPPKILTSFVTCKSCFATYRQGTMSCPSILPSGERCGAPPPPPKPKKEIRIMSDIELEELTGETYERKAKERWILKTISEASKMGRKPGFCFMQIKARYGIETAKLSWPIIREIYS